VSYAHAASYVDIITGHDEFLLLSVVSYGELRNGPLHHACMRVQSLSCRLCLRHTATQHCKYNGMLLCMTVLLVQSPPTYAGSLPEEWGTMRMMPANIEVYMRSNAGLSGTIPQSWAYFSSAYINLLGTNITGCIPGMSSRMCTTVPHACL
jgi:hypothetical protein